MSTGPATEVAAEQGFESRRPDSNRGRDPTPAQARAPLRVTVALPPTCDSDAPRPKPSTQEAAASARPDLALTAAPPGLASDR
jgi:hypothetical protein